jgi:hypothetical protein
MVRGTNDREQVKALAAAAALTIPGVCSHCGRINKQVVHAFGNQWFGENWDLTRLLDAIDSADHIRWVDDPGGYNLVVLIDGEAYRFQVRRPVQVKDAGSAA